MLKQKNITPDIIIDYNYDYSLFTPVAVIYVRPETNKIPYEKAIIKGIQNHADVIYMANINGQIFLKNALVIEHHSSEFRFAIYGKEEIAKYPEMIEQFEDHFKVKFQEAEIIGSFEALIKLKITQEEMFGIFVESDEFLRFFGQTIKKIGNYYVINYDMPALIEKYTPETDVFAIAIKFKDEKSSFKEINFSVSNEITSNCKSPIIFSENQKFNELDWIEKVKRTYHFSRNHLVAMFDMIDFVFKAGGRHICYEETPMGNLLVKNGITIDFLKKIKEHPVVYIMKDGIKRLVNIVDEACNKNIDESITLVQNAFNLNYA